ncbi:MAG: hypothetical protein PVG61_00375 [Dehalococcoidia bacterium]|jgi:hypothetical protein
MTTSPAQEQYEKEQRLLVEEVKKKTGKTPEQLYEEREKKIRDAIELREPETVPFVIHLNNSQYTGIPNSASYYDPISWKRAMRQMTLDLEPDMCSVGMLMPGKALDLLGIQNRLWPGGALPPDYEYQFVEGEYMKGDEYDLFLSDPSDFVIRYYLPRMYKIMAPLAKLPPIGNLFQGFEGLAPLFASPEFVRMAQTIYEAGKEMTEFRNNVGDAYEEMAQLGFPPLYNMGGGTVGGAPFDTISSFLRGMQGSMIDMFRRPEKLLQACDMILDRNIAKASLADPRQRGNPKRTGMPLWRGDKFFMSDEQFEKFYWPGLKRAIQATIDLGYVPVPNFEAKIGDRLEHMLELPRGKFIVSVEYVDVPLAKQILRDHACILAKAPLSSKVWSLKEVEKTNKEIIDICAPGGGLLLDVRLPDNGTKEEFKALLDSIREYSRR